MGGGDLCGGGGCMGAVVGDEEGENPMLRAHKFFRFIATNLWPSYLYNDILVDYISSLFYKQRVSALYLCVSHKSRRIVLIYNYYALISIS
jgi:hypothetical protein